MESKNKSGDFIPLAEYIKQNHNGVNSQFADVSGITRQGVGYLVKKGAIVGNGSIYTPTREFKAS